MCEKAIQKAGEAITTNTHYKNTKYVLPMKNTGQNMLANTNTRVDINRLVGVVWEEGVYETGVVQYTDIGKEAEINENTKIGTNTQIQTHKY